MNFHRNNTRKRAKIIVLSGNTKMDVRKRADVVGIGKSSYQVLSKCMKTRGPWTPRKEPRNETTITSKEKRRFIG